MRFYTLAGVDEASVHFEAPDLIDGQCWKWLPRRFYLTGIQEIKKLAEEFANCRSDPKAVVRFTKKYGPLRFSVSPNKKFRFRISAWLAAQREFRAMWKKRRGVRFVPVDTLRAKAGESFSISPRYFEYQTTSLYRLLFLVVLTFADGRLERCSRPDCPTPHFIATHLRQRYCSKPCFDWKQKELKKAWWNAKGKRLRAGAASRKQSRLIR